MAHVHGDEEEQLVALSIKAAQSWVHYALQNKVKSFSLHLSLRRSLTDYYDSRDDDDNYDSDDEANDGAYNDREKRS